MIFRDSIGSPGSYPRKGRIETRAKDPRKAETPSTKNSDFWSKPLLFFKRWSLEEKPERLHELD